MNKSSKEETDQKILLSLEIDLSKNKKEKIIIYKNSDINRVVYDFSLKFNLDYDSHLQLLKRIKKEKSNIKSLNTNSSSLKILRPSKSSRSYKNTMDNFYLKNISYINEREKKNKSIKGKFRKK